MQCFSNLNDFLKRLKHILLLNQENLKEKKMFEKVSQSQDMSMSAERAVDQEVKTYSGCGMENEHVE